MTRPDTADAPLRTARLAGTTVNCNQLQLHQSDPSSTHLTRSSFTRIRPCSTGRARCALLAVGSGYAAQRARPSWTHADGVLLAELICAPNSVLCAMVALVLCTVVIGSSRRRSAPLRSRFRRLLCWSTSRLNRKRSEQQQQTHSSAPQQPPQHLLTMSAEQVRRHTARVKASHRLARDRCEV